MAGNNQLYAGQTRMEHEQVIESLIELFGDTIDLAIIQSIAQTCDYNVDTASNILLEMSSTIGVMPKQYLEQNKSDDNNTHTFLYANITTNNSTNTHLSDSRRNQPDTKFSSPSKLTLTTNLHVPKKSKKEQLFDKVITRVRQGSKILIFMRGLPGSGKSYLAKQIVRKGLECDDYATFILSTDDYFINRRTGKYEYNALKISEAHNWNQQRANDKMDKAFSPVIIDNTNLQTWEMHWYTLMAIQYGYLIEIVEPFTQWAFNDKELARRNSHGVPRAKIIEMLNRYEKNITPMKLFNLWKLSYSSFNKPPIPRKHPPILHAPKNNTLGNGTNENPFDENSDLMDFEHVLSSHTLMTCSKGKQLQDFASSPIDSIISHSPMKTTKILMPTTKNSFHKHDTISNTPMVEPQIKKPRNVSLLPGEPRNSENMPNLLHNDNTVNSSANSKNNISAVEINKTRNLYPKLNLSSWGLTEHELSSWESWKVVHPLNCPNELVQSDFDQENEPSTYLETTDSTTNTSSADFSVLTNGCSTSDGVKIIKTENRNINERTVVTSPTSRRKKTLLDKSSMTNDTYTRTPGNNEKEIDDLISLFPKIPVQYLIEVYEKCKRDINWTVDLLLDDNKEILPIVLNDQPEDGESEKSQDVHEVENICLESLIIDRSKNVSSPEEKEEIKRHIEENIQINKDYYSKHMLKIKGQVHETCERTNGLELGKPSTSYNDKWYTDGVIIEVESDVDLNHFEPNIDYPEDESEEMMELNLGEGVVSQLETKFGLPEMFPREYLPMIDIPISLARQLHALYVESVLVQMENHNHVLDMIVKEDEEFAKKLYLQEFGPDAFDQHKTPNLSEIMNKQVAENLYQKEVNEWIKLTPDTLAVKLTRQKLYNAFPTVEKIVLMEILHAHNNSYEQTVAVLLDSQGRESVNDPDGTIREPPISSADVDEMKLAEDETNQTIYKPDKAKSANEYRDEANMHHDKHVQLMEKARQAFQRKQFPVAQFYSELAKTHTRLYDQANNLAASAFLQEHSQRLQNFSTLDLHYLYVKEAIAALDMFIDTNIQLLQGTNKTSISLFIITGRGNRSENGRSRIKPAAISRLRKRNIWYIQVNPGLLKIRIHPGSAITSSLP